MGSTFSNFIFKLKLGLKNNKISKWYNIMQITLIKYKHNKLI